MLRQLADMPAGTIGFEAVGEVDDDDWASEGEGPGATGQGRS